MSALTIALLLVILALSLLAIDLFVPTGGILIILGVLCALAAIGFGFAHSAAAGGWFIIFVLAAIPISLAIFVRYYPSTSIGRKMMMQRPVANAYTYRDQGGDHPQSWIGQVGLAKTELRPSGKIQIQDHILEAVSNSGIIEQGAAVKIVYMEMGVATVEPDYESAKPVAEISASEQIEIANQLNQTDLIASSSSHTLLDMSPDQFGLKDFEMDEVDEADPARQTPQMVRPDEKN